MYVVAAIQRSYFRLRGSRQPRAVRRLQPWEIVLSVFCKATCWNDTKGIAEALVELMRAAHVCRSYRQCLEPVQLGLGGSSGERLAIWGLAPCLATFDRPEGLTFRH